MGRKTTYDERIEIVAFCIQNNDDFQLAAEKYQVSYQQVYTWMKKYKEVGPEALADRLGKRRDPEKMTEAEKLAAQGVILCSGVGPVTTSFNGGNGTTASPYQIATAGQLLLLDNVVPTNGEHFKLIFDIELYRDYYVKAAFYGVLDGNEHTVTINANIPDDAQSGGVFAHITSVGRVSDLTVTGSINSTGDVVGGIAGFNQVTISSCVSRADITADSYVGGITGKNSGTVEGCSVRSGSITGDSMLGGLAGINYSAGIITNYYSHADIYMYANAAGGLLGWNQGTVRYCYSTGEIHDGLTNKGGLVGYKESGNISDSYYDKDTSGRNDTG